MKCNYEIYDKKLLIIIKCLKHWRSKLKTTNISIKIFIDHKFLKHFMIIKKLFRRQTRWALFLFEFNFKIMYQTKSWNVKTNSLTRLSKFTFKNEIDVRNKYQHQIILIFDRLKIQTMKLKKKFFIYDRILKANKIDETCFKYRRVIIRDRIILREIKLNECHEKKSLISWWKVMNIK